MPVPPRNAAKTGARTYSGVCVPRQAVRGPLYPQGLAHCFGAPCGYRPAFAPWQFATVSKAGSDRKGARSFSNWEPLKVPAPTKRDVRRSVQQTGWVTLEGGFAARECVVHDLSTTGAKLTVSDSSVLSGRVRLAFSRDASKGRKCQVVWRRGRSFGVKFVK